ncbi:hypothetical protein COCNU_01G020300 [Cocos nucifera]|uniref:Uncharacterized protein n=1 Tax=Cocos nucifera TaxID=13894 RepID=A0A8K0HX59_COCNU|nr:hypothetical protein COCNU_01G020300 [Cocos nucifera]
MESAIELPECPVCLQVYDWTATVPRVLACGHSVCEACLAALPIPRPNLPDAVRCPACTQLVPLPRSLGPSALPKNLELLRFSSSSPSPIPKSKPNPNPDPDPSPSPDFLPLPWTQSLLPAWKHSILPQDALSRLSLGAATTTDISTATISSPLGRPWCSRKNQRVSLFPINTSPFSSSLSFTESSQWFRLSYTMRVLEALYQLGDGVTDELGFLVDASIRHQRGLCKVFGLWMGREQEESRPCLVCERFDRSLADVLREGKRFGGGRVDGGDPLYNFGMVGMELCEAVMGLHSQGMVCGCLALSCFFFDDFGHCLLDVNQVLLSGRGIREDVSAMASRKGCDGPNLVESMAFISPEVLVSLFRKDVASDSGFDASVGYGSDVWSLACMLVMILLGNANLAAELVESFSGILAEGGCKNFSELYDVWKENAISMLEALLLDRKFESLLQILTSCLSYQPESRPRVIDIWHCICSLFTNTCPDDSAASDVLVANENVLCCLVLGRICSLLHNEADSILPGQGNDNIPGDIPDEDMLGSNESNADHSQQGKDDSNLVKGLHGGGLRSVTLQGHHDCVTGLAIGGGFLFSSSFDKTINVWSLQTVYLPYDVEMIDLNGFVVKGFSKALNGIFLKNAKLFLLCYIQVSESLSENSTMGTKECSEDFSHIQSWSGHEHRVMAMVVVDGTSQPICISGDSGSGIFIWTISTSLGKEPLKKWYEHNDWRYSGIHSLAVSATGFLYSGSGDKSIKAWSLQVIFLKSDCILVLHDALPLLKTGHKSTVSSLAVAEGILYSGSWDGTIRLWWLHDNSPLSILGNETPENLAPVLSLSIGNNLLVSSYENGFLKEFSQNELEMDIKTIGSITCDSVITSLLYWHGKLFVGFSNREIKVMMEQPLSLCQGSPSTENRCTVMNLDEDCQRIAKPWMAMKVSEDTRTRFRTRRFVFALTEALFEGTYALIGKLR